MSSSPVGLDLPEMVREDEEFAISVFGRLDPTEVECRIYDAQNGLMIEALALMVDEGKLSARARLSRAGLYRLEIRHSNESPLTQLITVLPTTAGSGS